jgi:hypothetical protein
VVVLRSGGSDPYLIQISCTFPSSRCLFACDFRWRALSSSLSDDNYSRYWQVKFCKHRWGGFLHFTLDKFLSLTDVRDCQMKGEGQQITKMMEFERSVHTVSILDR